MATNSLPDGQGRDDLEVCKQQMDFFKYGSKNGLSSHRINSFIIHGLWPSSGKTEGPKNCSSVHFDMNKIKNLTNELQHAWPNIYSNSAPNDFWKHEWKTHGTCALSLNTTGTEYLFFRKTLDLMKKYNASTFLSKMNITPNDTTPYVTKTIESVLQKKLGVMPNLQCYRYKLGKRQTYLLAEIRICMDKQFKLFKCPNGDSTLYWNRLSQTQRCYGGKIYFPEIKKINPLKENHKYMILLNFMRLQFFLCIGYVICCWYNVAHVYVGRNKHDEL
ncbi:RNASET2 [Mytilus coruscus]|uniref:RNASET2 n=1 Tax=Mytilus coruscus TaxID=42192 RepID=A0A6J8C5Q1_MYTCO|nr:RNASET2 [Mytilus coruscus]